MVSSARTSAVRGAATLMSAPSPPVITGGAWRGRRLVVPPGLSTRPTRSLVRQALFNLLGPDAIEGAQVLDLYSGSGALGLEALSRGAAVVHFVESDRRALEALRQNLETCGAERDRAHVLPVDCRRLLLANAGPFQLVTADPPFALHDALPTLMADDGVWSAGARLAYHGPAEGPAPRAPAGWTFEQTRSYGRSAWHLFVRA